MTWKTEWTRICAEITALHEIANLWGSAQTRGQTAIEVMTHIAAKSGQDCLLHLKSFADTFGAGLPEGVGLRIQDLVARWSDGQNFRGGDGLPKVLRLIADLRSSQAAVDYVLADTSVTIRRTSERAFQHLQRSIVADPTVRERWEGAFGRGEPACEKLGAAHLLLHGIWAFKVNSTGERTDLVFADTCLNPETVESAAEGLVLTEWKVVQRTEDRDRKINEARTQAELYSAGSLASLELAGYRYLVMVSPQRLDMPGDDRRGEVVYRHINIAVDPSNPSVAARKTSGESER